ncbi:MAG: hypothetical protein HZA79_06405 [Sphingobacteriales bacterium]|nr:hypothetical protein [Sphingobacteriales bacterium]
MKKLGFLLFCLLLAGLVTEAQPGKKPKNQPAAQPDMNKLLEEAMKTEGMSKEEQEEMKKMMKGVMPAMEEHNNTTADYPEFSNNRDLVPRKNPAKINAAKKKILSQPEISGYAASLCNKILAKADAAESALIKKVLAQSPNARDLAAAAVLAMQQGHPELAMALSMKAVQAEPANPVYQNNMASLLAQYGFPELAIPVLQKLRNEYPLNSTVLNNLGQAWFGLGETDSANTLLKKAGGLNPYHPEVKQTEGVIEETKGNPEKAAGAYKQSLENVVNPFTEQLLKNSNNPGSINNLDFEKIKRSITIHEFFPKNWIYLPELENSVNSYESNAAIINGYQAMLEKLDDKIEKLEEAANRELDDLMKEGETEFAKKMMEESIAGLSMMSRPATTVMMVLQAWLQQWTRDYQTRLQELRERINRKRIEMTTFSNNDKCPDFDRKHNDFMQYANPVIRKFHTEKIEEFRTWLNAFCTWRWYIVGDPKNSSLAACIGWTAALSNLYESAVSDMVNYAKSCVKQNGNGSNAVTGPEVPNFTCPVVVSIPAGTEWTELSNASKDFNKNNYGIKKTNKPVPNLTTSYAAGNGIGEPGKSPFVKMANGSVTAGMNNQAEEPLAPLGKIPNPDDPAPLPTLTEIIKRNVEKQLLNKYRTSNCNQPPKKKKIKFEVSLGELVLEGPMPVKERQTESGYEIEYEDGSADFIMEDGSILHLEAPNTYTVVEGEPKASVTRKPPNPADKVIPPLKEFQESYNKNGLVPSISSGLQSPGIFDYLKNIFN